MPPTSIAIMEPERWRRTEELYHAAAALQGDDRIAFLRDACREDDALLRDVESLIAADAVEDFLDGPPLILPGHLHVDLMPASMAGRTLGVYQLQELLGAGGMGEVYRARDTKLDRDVAIKILAPGFTSDENRLARLEREARMLASLNHPNICSIYGSEEANGVRFLILELVDGNTLAALLAKRGGALPLPEVLALASGIAEALEVAHEKGIVHRDLKPSNIKITAEGTVKVLDFGLAKIVEPGRPADLSSVASGSRGARGGQLIGTAAYMSPEQARGLPVDKRTDIWAFGCVLYEMLSGRIAFAGETASDSIAKVLEREPDWSALPNTTTAQVRRLLRRCVAKDPKARLLDIGDWRIALDAADNNEATQLAPVTANLKRRQWVVAAVVLLAVALPAVLWRPAVTENPLAGATFTPLTNWEGAEEGAEISPDGKFVAFLADHDGEFDIWLSQIGTGQFANLTRGVPPLVGSGVIVRKLGFSGDGSEIWFNPADRKPLLLLPMTGGAPRAFLPEGSNTPAWSPDGQRVVYFQKPFEGDDPMVIADRHGANPRQIPLRATNFRASLAAAAVHNNNPAWSPDGDWVYFSSGEEPQNEMDVDIWRVRPSGGPAERLTNQHAAANYAVAIDSRTVLYVARDADGGGPWLWSLDVNRKSTSRVSPGVEQYMSISASRDGRRVVATVSNPSSSLWRVPLRAAIATEADAEPHVLPVRTGWTRAPRFNRETMFYLSAGGTGDGLWQVRSDQSVQVWRDVDAPLFEPAAVSPDGRELAVIVRRDGKRSIWLTSENGSSRRTLADSIEIQGAAGQGAIDWSPDGQWIIAGGRDARGPALFKIPVNGGSPERIVDGICHNPVWSPKGDLIVYAGRSNVGQVQLLAVRPDGTAVEMPPLMVRPGGYRFVPDGSGLVYLAGIHALDFWLLEIATAQPRRLTQLGSRGSLRTFDVTPDGTAIVFDRFKQNSNIMLIEFRDPQPAAATRGRE